MKGTLHVVGLGPATLEQMSVGSYRLLRQGMKIFVRTVKHPCVQELAQEGIAFESFDALYEKSATFAEVYQGIVDALRRALEEHDEVIYAVPGHPNVAEKSVELIREQLAPEYTVHIHPAVSFLDSLFTAVGCDPVEGCLIRSSESVKDGGITGKDWLIIPQIYDRFVASELKLDLMRYYPDECEVFLLSALGTPEEKVRKIMLYELDRYPVDHLTTVAVPPTGKAVAMEKLLHIMEVLRSPEGCPWDRQQNHETLRPYVIEEAYEVAQAIDSKDPYNLSEELGDLLLQVVFHAQVAKENGDFDFQDVVKGIVDKLIRRHPHVFGHRSVTSADEVLKTWEEIKRAEKPASERAALFKDPLSLPALTLAEKTQKRAARYGFDWEDYRGPLDKVYEELAEFQEVIGQNSENREAHSENNASRLKEELGDVLFSIVNLARFFEIDAEEALRVTTRKFQQRFTAMMERIEEEGHDPEKLTLEQLDRYWELTKNSNSHA